MTKTRATTPMPKALCAALALAASGLVTAQSIDWRTEVASEASTAAFGTTAIESAPGTVLIAQFGDQGSAASWFLRDGAFVPAGIDPGPFWNLGYRLWEANGAELVVGESEWTARPLSLDRSCARERLADGVLLRTHRTGPYASQDVSGTRVADTDGSSVDVSHPEVGRVRLLRRDADCSGRVLAEWSSASAWLVDGKAPGSRFVVRDEPLTVQPGGSELLHVQGDEIDWTRDFPEPDAGRRRIVGAVALADGGIAVLATGQTSVLARLDAAGDIAWQVPIEASEGILAAGADSLHVLVRDPLPDYPYSTWGERLGFDLDGGSLGAGPIPSGLAAQPLDQSPWRAADALWTSSTGEEGLTLHRLGGAEGFEQVAGPFPGERSLLELGDGSILLETTDGRAVRRIDADGAALGEAVTLPALPAALQDVYLAHADAAGMLLSTLDLEGVGRSLRAFAPDGELAWQRTPANLVEGHFGALVAGAEGTAPLCEYGADNYADDFSLACIDRLSGDDRLGPLTIPGTGAGQMAGVLPQVDGSVVVLRVDASGGQLQRAVVSPAGEIGGWSTVLEAPLHDLRPQAGAARGEDGSWLRSAYVPGEWRGRLLRHSNSGLQSTLVELPAGWDWPHRGGVVAAADSGALLFDMDPNVEQGAIGHGLNLLRLDSALVEKWQANLQDLRFLGPDGGSPPSPPRGSDPKVVRVGERWLAWGWSIEGELRMVALDDADGSVLWQRDLRHRFSGEGDPILAEDGRGRLLLARSRRDSVELSWLDPADGRTLWATRLAQVGKVASVHVGPDGAIRLLSQRGPEHGVPSQRALLMQVEPLPDPLPAAPAVAQPALQGAWYDPAASGQGMFLDVLPEADTVAGAWFAFSTEGGHARRQQRWYTLHAEVVAGSQEVSLDIRRSAGGRFAQGPAVDSEVVGSARLRLLDCDRALLDYAFDAVDSDGLPGTILLQRLTPRGADCGEAANPAADSRSGFWYDPASSGQGLVISAFPAAPDPAGGVFAAWFTFDPDGAADDPHAQHWFSLVGEETLPDGAIRARLLRTIGGSFDDAATSNTEAVGEVHLRFDGCDALTLDYAFDEVGFAAEFAALAGSQSLRRIGGCQ